MGIQLVIDWPWDVQQFIDAMHAVRKWGKS